MIIYDIWAVWPWHNHIWPTPHHTTSHHGGAAGGGFPILTAIVELVMDPKDLGSSINLRDLWTICKNEHSCKYLTTRPQRHSTTEEDGDTKPSRLPQRRGLDWGQANIWSYTYHIQAYGHIQSYMHHVWLCVVQTWSHMLAIRSYIVSHMIICEPYMIIYWPPVIIY